MSSIKLTADSGGGTFEIKAPSSGSNTRVLTLPDSSSGTVLTTTNPKSGNVLQVVSSVKTDTASASVSRTSDWVGHGLSVSITPSSASNKILITGQISISEVNAGNSGVNVVLYKDGSALTGATGDASSNRKRATAGDEVDFGFSATSLPFHYLDTAGGTSSITYQPALNTHHSTGHTMYVNRTYDDTDDASYVRTISIITVMEIAA